MATERLEPFRQALLDLRGRLRDGRLAPGARITAKEVAEGLKLSPTPVREALSRLAGEGLLEERRGDGFFVPSLSTADIRALYQLSEQFLLMSQGSLRAPHREARPPERVGDDDAVRTVERLFLAWVSEADSRIVLEGFRTTAIRLAPVRRRETRFITDLEAEAWVLFDLAGAAQRARRSVAIQAFHTRRLALADALARSLEADAPNVE